MKRLTAVAFWIVLIVSMGPTMAAISETEGIGDEKHYTAKGYKPEQLFFATGGADVNPFNFNLIVSFSEPVGFSTPVNGGLSLSLNRVYNSAAYSERSWQCSHDCGSGTSDSRSYLSIPRENPMGLGWSFHLGRIYGRDRTYGDPPSCGQADVGQPGPLVFLAPDGSEHVLYRDPTNQTEYYTKDGSMIKAEIHPPSPPDYPIGWWEVSLPDGRIMELAHQVDADPFDEAQRDHHCGTSGAGGPYFVPDDQIQGEHDRDKIGWHTTLIRTRETDANGPTSWIKVEYQPAPLDYIIKRVYDSHHGPAADRSIEVGVDADPGSNDYGLIKTVSYPVPQINGVTQPKVVTNFNYADHTISIVDRTLPVVDHVTKVLESVIFDVPGSRYGFRYAYHPTPAGTWAGVHASGTNWGAQLKEIHYPSGKAVEFTYQQFTRRSRDSASDSGNPLPECECIYTDNLEAKFVGVGTKEEFVNGVIGDTTTPNNHRLWTFGLDREYDPNGDEIVTDECWGGGCNLTLSYYNAVSSMIDPAGNRSEIKYDTTSHYTWRTDFPWKGPSNHPKHGTEIEIRQYEGEGALPPVRKTVKQWGYNFHDETYGVSWPVQTREEVHYLDDVDATGAPLDTVLVTNHSNWRSNGRYGFHETTTLSGNAIGNWQKIIYTDYAIDNDTCYPSEGPSPETEWLPNLVTSQSTSVKIGVEDSVQKELTESAFSLVTGRTEAVVRRVNAEAIIADPCHDTLGEFALQNGDIVTELGYDAYGNVDEERVRFGSGQGQEFITDRTYSHGVVATSKNRNLSYFDVIATVDPDTSVVRQEEYNATVAGDPAAVARSTEYDEFRRPKEERVGLMQTWYTDYVNVSLDADRDRLEHIRVHQGSGDSEIETKEYYDFAGRIERRAKLNPDGNSAYQHTEYDSAGRVRFVSEWTGNASCSPDCETDTAVVGTTTDYTTSGVEDPFGRPRTVTGPLGEETTYSYFGTNKSVTVSGIAAAGDGRDFGDPTGSVATTYYTDGLGRLRAVDSPSAFSDVTGNCGPGPCSIASSPAADAIYEYDYAGRLRQVNLVYTELTEQPTTEDRYAFSNDLAQAQTRTFTYDSLGRQESSDHPESGLTETWGWNALGSPTKVQDALGEARGHYHETLYDTAGRPVEVRRVLDGTSPAIDETVALNDTGWTATNEWRLVTAGDCVTEAAWYLGTTGCVYSQQSEVESELVSPSLPKTAAQIEHGTTLSFRYYREVRNHVGQASERDIFTVEVAADEPTPTWTEVFRLDSTQISWLRWKRSPAIPLDEWEGKKILVRFKFDSDDDLNTTLAKGIAISEVSIQRPDSLTLSTTDYDLDLADCDDDPLEPNRSLGQVVRTVVYDESTQQPAFTKEFCFEQSEGRLSKEKTDFDWDRDGDFSKFRASYVYNAMGQLETQVLPHEITETDPRQVDYTYRHGALVGVGTFRDWSSQGIAPDSSFGPGFEYNLAGGIERIRYGSGLETHIQPNEAFLPEKIWVEDEAGAKPFETGTYFYDGARNIKAIGNDIYRYDAVGRLRRAKVNSITHGDVYIDYQYDHWGNMTNRKTGPTTTDYGVLGPEGLNFEGRTYTDGAYHETDNQIHDTDWFYDENGNLIKEPSHGATLGNYRYTFSPENRMTLVRGLTAGKIYQESRYDAGGNRWARVISGDGGEALLTLRDASGQVAAEYMETPATSGPYVQKHYVRGNGKLLATQSVCGPPPLLALGDVNNVPGMVFLKQSLEIGLAAEGDFTLHIEGGSSGQVNIVPLDEETGETFSIPTSELFPGENTIRLRAEVQCGQTGYSNAVTYALPTGGPPPPTCIQGIGVSQQEFDRDPNTLQPRSTVHVQINGKFCLPGTEFNIYRIPLEGGTPELLDRITAFDYEMRDTPIGSGLGVYYFAEVESGGGGGDTPGPEATNSMDNAGTGSAGLPGEASWKTEYVHSDHLGSTRLVTDELGLTVAEYKYFPFGLEADTNSGSDLRMKFTGHERDRTLSLDYMLARYRGTNVGFLSVDPADDSVISAIPKSWNRYSYAWNNPTNLVDPDGERVRLPSDEEERKKVLALIAAALQDSTAAARLTVDKRAGGHYLTVSGSMKGFMKSSPTARMLGKVIGHKKTLDVSVAKTDDTDQNGGAVTEEMMIQNPHSIERGTGLARTTIDASHFPRPSSLGNWDTDGTVFFHELGHAYAVMTSKTDMWGLFGGSADFSIDWENDARAWYRAKADATHGKTPLGKQLQRHYADSPRHKFPGEK